MPLSFLLFLQITMGKDLPLTTPLRLTGGESPTLSSQVGTPRLFLTISQVKMQAARVELSRLLAESCEAEGLSEGAAKWCSDQGVLQRYVDCANANGCPAEQNVRFLTRTASWREEMLVDGMGEDEALRQVELKLRALMLYHLSRDSTGRPLMIQRVGAWDVAALTEFTSAHHEDVMRAHVLVDEWIRQQVDRLAIENPIPLERQAVLIFDMEGLSWAHLSATSLMSLFSSMCKLDSDHFPDTVRPQPHGTSIPNA